MMSTLINKEKIIAANLIQELQKQIDTHEAKIARIKNSKLDDKYIKKTISESEFCITSLREEKLKQMKRYSYINQELQKLLMNNVVSICSNKDKFCSKDISTVKSNVHILRTNSSNAISI